MLHKIFNYDKIKRNNIFQRRIIIVFSRLKNSMFMGLLLSSILFVLPETALAQKNAGNFTDEMKMPYAVNLNDMGANAVERKADYRNSPYFSHVDFYNLRSSKSLFMIEKFKTIQQTSWWSCGISSLMMVLNHNGSLGDWNEQTLANLRTDHSSKHLGTCLEQMIEMVEKSGNKVLESTYDYQGKLEEIDMKFFRTRIQAGTPVLIGWNDWGGHWQVVIGYDTMGTEYEGDDVLIVADPFDTTDHNQDGYGVYSAVRFINNFTFFDFFGDKEHLRDKCFLTIKTPEQK